MSHTSIKPKHRSNRFIGVDFDGTLSKYDRFVSPSHTGDPVLPMVNRVQKWLREGKNVKIFTARVSLSHTEEERTEARLAIENWCLTYIGQQLEVIADKDPKMYELWDDKAVSVQKNTGHDMRQL